MNRRNFLGSVIGLWAGSEFFARTIKEKPQIIEKSIEDYSITIFDDLSGQEIRSTGIKDIISSKESWKFIAHPLIVSKRMRVSQIFFYKNYDLTLVRMFQMELPAFLNKDNQFNCMCEIKIPESNTNDFEKALNMVKFK